ncbi:MAG: hypothetical protein RL335_120 [Bacteroidota bacterium]|jgi:hypothetical protein
MASSTNVFFMVRGVSGFFFLCGLRRGLDFYKRLINILFGIGNLPTFAPRW